MTSGSDEQRDALDQLVAELSRDVLRKWVGDICERAATAITQLRQRVADAEQEREEWKILAAADRAAAALAASNQTVAETLHESALAERDRRIAELEAELKGRQA